MIEADLIRLRPRAGTIHVSQGRTVLATALDGQIGGGKDHGLFVHQTRMLSVYRYFIDQNPVSPVALSNVEQHSWLGYYIVLAPGAGEEEEDTVSAASQQALELRVSRYAGGGLHEDLDLTNFTQNAVTFDFAVELDADFASQSETGKGSRVVGELRREWRQPEAGVYELAFNYNAKHTYDHQGESGTAAIERGLRVRLENMTFDPATVTAVSSFPCDCRPMAAGIAA